MSSDSFRGASKVAAIMERSSSESASSVGAAFSNISAGFGYLANVHFSCTLVAYKEVFSGRIKVASNDWGPLLMADFDWAE